MLCFCASNLWCCRKRSANNDICIILRTKLLPAVQMTINLLEAIQLAIFFTYSFHTEGGNSLILDQAHGDRVKAHINPLEGMSLERKTMGSIADRKFIAFYI